MFNNYFKKINLKKKIIKKIYKLRIKELQKTKKTSSIDIGLEDETMLKLNKIANKYKFNNEDIIYNILIDAMLNQKLLKEKEIDIILDKNAYKILKNNKKLNSINYIILDKKLRVKQTVMNKKNI